MVEKTNTAGFWPSLYDPFRTLGTRLADWLAPATDAKSDADAYLITMELPGVAEDDIHLSVEDGVVAIRGEKKSEREQTGETWYFSERQYGNFQRSFRLPQDADETGIRAALKDGVLTVTVPRKAQATFKTSRVPIERG